jgi:glycosyltransferase involved in cell wall biosynthesis
MNSTKHLLIIGIVWPEPNSSAAGSRMLQLIEVFKNHNWKITFASSATKTDFCFDPKDLGIETHAIEINNSSFDTFIKQLNPDCVLFDRFITEEQFGWRVSEICPAAMRIIDTEDLHCLRAARQQAFKEGKEFEESYLINDTAKREIASVLRSDLSLIISNVEMELLQSFFKVDKCLLHYIPFLLDKMDDKVKWKSFEERSHFISIGNFLHEPNWNAVLYLKESIWPLIRKQLPSAEMHVYGAYPSQKVEQLHNAKEGFLIKGRAEDAKEVMSNTKVCLAPLRFGAGLKGKLIEAMQCGTPSVTTDIGAEGMHNNLPWNGAIENTAETFAKSAVELYTNETLWKQSQQNGIQIINECFDKNLFEEQFVNRINDLQSNLKSHRQQNFTGAMLMNHTASSTKYMSKWIEEKNK